MFKLGRLFSFLGHCLRFLGSLHHWQQQTTLFPFLFLNCAQTYHGVEIKGSVWKQFMNFALLFLINALFLLNIIVPKRSILCKIHKVFLDTPWILRNDMLHSRKEKRWNYPSRTMPKKNGLYPPQRGKNRTKWKIRTQKNRPKWTFFQCSNSVAWSRSSVTACAVSVVCTIKR